MSLEFTQRFRRHVAPYDVVQSLAVLSGSNYCPAIQTIKAGGTPNIDRTTAPTVIQATVTATASDSSGAVASITDSAITNIKWMVQKGTENSGTDITLHADWTGKFTVGTGADKGKLTVKMNVPAGTTWKIWMECVISDQRRGYTVPISVVTDSVLIYSISDATEKYTMSIDRPSGEIYEIARDRRLIHERLTGLGQTSTLVDDGNTYLRTVTATLRKGGVQMQQSEYSVKVYRIGSTGTRTEVTAATDDCISSISGRSATFDLRFAESGTYQIACLVGTDEVARKSYGWAWSAEMPTTDEGLVGGATYSDGKKQTYRPKFNFGKGMLRYPSIAFEMKWHYRNLGTSTKVYVGGGEQHTYNLTDTAIFTDSVAEPVLTVGKRGAFAFIATASSGGNRYVDENGDYLIEN